MAAHRRALLAALLGLASILASLPACAESARVTFLLVNDIYLMSDEAMPDGVRRGGFARLAAIVKSERAKGGHVILAHAGDTLSPSLLSGLDKGGSMLALTNLVSPDIFVPGNHEFDYGKSIFLQRMAEAKFPLFAANLRGPDGAALPDFKDRAIVTLDGVRIGLTGATYDDTPRASSPEDLKFTPAVATMKEQAQALRREGADFVAVVAHAGRRQDIAMMSIDEIDLVLSGHDHDLFIDFDGRRAAVESSYNAHYVTAVDIAIDVKLQDGKRVTAWWPQFRVIDTATVTPDPEVAAVIARYEQELSQEIDTPIGTTSVELDSRTATVRAREAAIGNIIADAMRATAHADAAVTNGGGIRGGRVYLPGATLSRRDVLAELPFGNRMVVIEISGRDLKAAIENGISQLPDPSGRFPQIAGLTIAADGSRPPGSRITSIKIGNAPLEDTKTYRVATNDFMARGGDGYTIFRDARQILPGADAPPLANEVVDYIKQEGTLRTSVEGRLVVR
jgi:5'-nucleotidase / UDP-sugar diphosphatase